MCTGSRRTHQKNARVIWQHKLFFTTAQHCINTNIVFSSLMLNSKSAEASYQCISQSENDFHTTAHQKSPPLSASTPNLPRNLMKQKNKS
jgi:hypothetical protein